MLIEAGARPSVMTQDGYTPWQIARRAHPAKHLLHSLLDGTAPPSECGSFCDVCHIAQSDCPEGLSVCPCDTAMYCSGRCQGQAWPQHEKECKRLQKEKKDKQL